jgi:hypothetical protein
MSYLEERRNQKMYGKPPKEKKVYQIPKKSAKKIKEEQEEKAAGTDVEMDLFFQAMRKRMKGKCLFCGQKSAKGNDEIYHFSIAHLLPKAIFKSVATNESNWVELCFYSNSCHTNFDSGKITWEFIKDSKEWDIIKEKLLHVLPAVAMEERKHKLYSKLEGLVYDKAN